MGSWQLEVCKMAVYTMFPVALFHYFNHPAYFEAWVTDTKRRIMPPENLADRELVHQTVAEHRQRQLNQFK